MGEEKAKIYKADEGSIYISSDNDTFLVKEEVILNYLKNDTRLFEKVPSLFSMYIKFPLIAFYELKEKAIIDKDLILPERLKVTILFKLEISIKEKLLFKNKNQIFIVLRDFARFLDSGGTDQDREISYNELVTFTDRVSFLNKMSFITWKKYIVAHPYTSFWYYTKIIYFKDAIEFWEFKHEYRNQRLKEKCPVCSERIKSLGYCFFDVDMPGSPYYFCSKECLHTFTGRIRDYRKIYHYNFETM